MSDSDSVARICHESQVLRLQAADLESRAQTIARELRQTLEQRHTLMARLRETQVSFSQSASAATHKPRRD